MTERLAAQRGALDPERHRRAWSQWWKTNGHSGGRIPNLKLASITGGHHVGRDCPSPNPRLRRGPLVLARI